MCVCVCEVYVVGGVCVCVGVGVGVGGEVFFSTPSSKALHNGSEDVPRKSPPLNTKVSL